jgi:carbamoyl-phosphate synthase large subunit
MAFRILLTSTGGGLACQTILHAQSSQRHQIEIVGVDMREDIPARRLADKFETVPRGDDPAYADRICEIVKMHDVDLVLPCSDEEAIALAASRIEVEQAGAQLATVKSDVLNIFADKSLTYQSLDNAGLPVADWRSIVKADDLDQAIDDFIDQFGDVVVKPAKDRGGRGVFIINNDLIEPVFQDGAREIHLNLNDFKSTYREQAISNLPLLVCERLIEPVYDADILAWNGKAHFVVPRHRLNPAVPNDGHILINNSEIVEIGHRIADLFNLSWLYDVDMMCGRDGTPRIIEINPRPSGSLAVPLLAGVPLIDGLISLAEGKNVETPANISINRRIVPYTVLAMLEGEV